MMKPFNGIACGNRLVSNKLEAKRGLLETVSTPSPVQNQLLIFPWLVFRITLLPQSPHGAPFPLNTLNSLTQ